MSMQCLTVVLLFLSAVDTSGAEGDSTTIRALTAGMSCRYETYRNLEFQLSVHETIYPAPEPLTKQVMVSTQVKSLDTLNIMSPIETISLRPWWSWERKTEDANENLIVDSFVAFDGLNSRVFTRTHGAKSTWSRGEILPWEDSAAARRCYFNCLLFLDHNGISRLSDDAKRLSESLDQKRNYKVQKDTVDAHDVYTLKADATPQWPIAYTVKISEAPDFLVLRFEAKHSDTNETALLYDLHFLKKRP
jgi:hypothetical protein